MVGTTPFRLVVLFFPLLILIGNETAGVLLLVPDGVVNSLVVRGPHSLLAFFAIEAAMYVVFGLAFHYATSTPYWFQSGSLSLSVMRYSFTPLSPHSAVSYASLVIIISLWSAHWSFGVYVTSCQ